MSRHHKYQVTENHDRINNILPHDAVFKTFMFTPETARDFLEIHLPEPLRKLCNLQTLRPNPLVLLKKFTRLLLGCFVVRGNQRR